MEKLINVATDREIKAIFGFVTTGDDESARKLIILLLRKYFAK
jgi:hypothetical protein